MAPRRIRTWLLAVVLATAAATLGSFPTLAAFPERPPRILVGFVPGGTSDVVARLVAEAVEPFLGQRVVVENRPGANGLVAAEAMVRGPADGYTVFQCATGLMTITPELPDARLPIDPAVDLLPIANVANSSLALVVPADSPHRSLAELIAAARGQPGRVTYASAGIASTSHVAAAQLGKVAGVELVHVPYRGSAAGVLDVVGGRVSMMLTNINDVVRLVQGGSLRLLGVNDALGQAIFPNAPLLSFAVPGYDVNFWLGICGPRGMPAEAVDRWQAAIAAALQRPALRQRLQEGGLAPRFEDPAAFARTIAKDRQMWRELVRAAGIRAE